MTRRVRAPSPAIVSIALGLLMAGCARPEPTSGENTKTLSDTIAFGGLILFEHGGDFQVLDPSTGKRSPRVPRASAADSGRPAVAVSPDGRYVAYFEPRTTTFLDLIIAELGLVDGAPAITPIGTWPVAYGTLEWSADGERVIAGSTFIDPTKPGFTVCGGGTTPIGTDANAYSRAPAYLLAGGNSICPKPQTLEHEGVKLADLPGAQGYGHYANLILTADEQLIGPVLHAPTGTVREATPEFTQDLGFQSFGVRVALPDGTVGTYENGEDGDVIGYREDSTGMVVSQYIRHVTAPLLDGHRYDLHSSFATGVWKEGPNLPGASALRPWLIDGQGRYFNVAAVVGTGTIVYGIVSQNITISDNGLLFPDTVETALVEVSPDGSARGLRTSTLRSTSDGQKLIEFEGFEQLFTRSTLEFADGDWLYPAGPHWAGFLEGQPVVLADVGGASRDGTVFVWSPSAEALASTHRNEICIRPTTRAAETRCMPGINEPERFVAVVGDRGPGAPLIYSVSRSAAQPGSKVFIHGARFGDTPATLRVGDATVSAAAIDSWSDTRIVFTMEDSLPASGQVRVETAAGTSPGRTFRLNKTVALSTPFAQATRAVTPVGQGFNHVDLGLPPGVSPAPDSPLSDTLRDEDGRHVIWSAGGDDEDVPMTLTVQHLRRLFSFRAIDRLVAHDRWQLVRRSKEGVPDLATYRSGFVTIAREPIDHESHRHPLFGDTLEARVTDDFVQPRGPGVTGTYGLPDFWREAPDGSAWVINHFNNSTGAVQHLTGWRESTNQRWGYPQYEGGVQGGGYYATGVDAIGSTLLLVGGDPSGTSAAGMFRLSQDGGHSWPGAPTLITDTEAGFVEPIHVTSPGGDYFLVFEADWNGGPVLGVHRVNVDGTFTPDVTAVPPMLKTAAQHLSGYHRPFDFVQSGARLLVFSAWSFALATVDLGAATPTWTSLPTAADAAQVRAFFRDAAQGAVYIVKLDGSVWRASDASGWSDWSRQDFDFDLPFTRVTPLALTRAPDGRWLVNAALFDARPGAAPNAASAFGYAGWLLGPSP